MIVTTVIDIYTYTFIYIDVYAYLCVSLYIYIYSLIGAPRYLCGSS
jgi:hypothetical protein